MMVELEDDEDWSMGDDEDDDDTDSNAVAGESGLDRLACALGGKSMLPHILSNVPTMLQASLVCTAPTTAFPVLTFPLPVCRIPIGSSDMRR